METIEPAVLSSANPPPRGFARGDLPFLLLAVVPPIVPVLAFLIEWLVAWVTLGHIPIGGVDDPKFISPLSSMLHSITALSFLGFLPLSAFALWACAVKWGICRRTVIVEAVTIAMVIGTFAVLGLFPHDAMGWWLD